jgi:peptidyl-dipeptidase Dcp
MLDRDSRKWFMDHGGLTRANGDHFRATVLSQGGTQDYFEMYRAFTGHEPDVQPMLQALGLTGGGDATGSDDGGNSGAN